MPAFALAVKSTAFRRMTSALVEVYPGRDAARSVLKGRIERGKVDSIKAVLWFSGHAQLHRAVGKRAQR